jgi:hypothetical protein
MGLFRDWLLGRHLGLVLNEADAEALEGTFALLRDSALEQPRTFVHRDYHSRNLMCGVAPDHRPGILDFQDAVHGPLTYDAVSLLRDCYVVWPADRITGWALGYYQAVLRAGLVADGCEGLFLRWFDLMGIQRHLKASGIFARLWHRDGKAGYLKDVPRTLTYITEVGARYPELGFLCRLIQDRALPGFREIQDNP